MAAKDKNRVIAPGCVDCNFDQFVRHIQEASRPFTGKTSVGDNRTPDVVATAKELNNPHYNAKYDPAKLLKEGTIADSKLNDLIGGAVQRILSVQTQVGSDDEALKNLLAGATTALQGAQQARQIQISTPRAPATDSNLKSSLFDYFGYDPNLVTKKSIEGAEYQVIDEDATVAAGHKSFKEDLEAFYILIGTKKNKKYKLFNLHWPPIQYMQEMVGKLKAPCV